MTTKESQEEPKTIKTFEEATRRLDELIKQMESGTLPVDEMIKAFEEGNTLVKFCTDKLQEIERRVETIKKDGSRAPFEDK